jgi:hypothetical protein
MNAIVVDGAEKRVNNQRDTMGLCTVEEFVLFSVFLGIGPPSGESKRRYPLKTSWPRS